MSRLAVSLQRRIVAERWQGIQIKIIIKTFIGCVEASERCAGFLNIHMILSVDKVIIVAHSPDHQSLRQSRRGIKLWPNPGDFITKVKQINS